MFEYRANIVRVIDGDTVEADVDLGCDVHARLTLRLMGVNAPEHGNPEGEAATDYVRNWIHNHGGIDGAVIIDTFKDRTEKYGRYLARVRGWIEGAETFEPEDADRVLNEMLVEEGHAVAYDGGVR